MEIQVPGRMLKHSHFWDIQPHAAKGKCPQQDERHPDDNYKAYGLVFSGHLGEDSLILPDIVEQQNRCSDHNAGETSYSE